jgi:uncharacterized protein YidB (DUF937 family)
VIGRLVGGEHGTANAPAAGLPALLARFERAGLGGIAHSWVGNGPNLPLSAGQLRSALGEAGVAELTRGSALPAAEILAQVAAHLPAVVNRLTPDGRLPAAAPG